MSLSFDVKEETNSNEPTLAQTNQPLVLNGDESNYNLMKKMDSATQKANVHTHVKSKIQSTEALTNISESNEQTQSEHESNESAMYDGTSRNAKLVPEYKVFNPEVLSEKSGTVFSMSDTNVFNTESIDSSIEKRVNELKILKSLSILSEASDIVEDETIYGAPAMEVLRSYKNYEDTQPFHASNLKGSHQTLDDIRKQIQIVQQQNNSLIESQAALFGVVNTCASDIQIIKANIEQQLLITSMKINPATEPYSATSSTTSEPTPQSMSDFTKLKVILSENPNKIKVGNTSHEISLEDYESILLRSPDNPPTVTVKLLSLLFPDSELYNSNIAGKMAFGKPIRGKLDPEKIGAIINQIKMQFPTFMKTKVNVDKVYAAINGKCRRLTEKMNKVPNDI